MLHRFIKRNSLMLIFFAISAVMALLILIELDKQYYQAEKRALIQEYRWYYIDRSLDIGGTDTVDLLAEQDLNQHTPASQDRVRNKIWSILNNDGIVYRIRIQQTDSPSTQTLPSAEYNRKRADQDYLDLEAPGKLARMNNFSNSLLMRNFSGIISLPLKDYAGRETGRMIVHYTTPLGDPAINELTQQYRIYAAFILVIISVLTGSAARAILLPLRNVMNQLESSTPEQTHFVARPRAKLELLYNRMALEAVAARMQGRLREEISGSPQMTGWEVVHSAVLDFQSRAEVPLVIGIELVAEGPGSIRSTGNHVLSPFDLAPPDQQAELLGWLEAHLPTDTGREQVLTPPLNFTAGDLGLKVMPDPDRTGIRYLFALGLGERFGVDGSGEPLGAMLDRLISLVEAGLQTLSVRNQLLVQERGRANISLSRNLGHDLTNIIATSKLELMALERALGRGQDPPDERRRAILVEALHGLLRSVKFMQETVNLYRAYAYLQHPVLEVHDGNVLLSDTLDLFAISTSSKIELIQELAPDAPRCLVDPRLIKLALFNMFTNALEAIRKIDPEHQVRGWIKVISRRSREGGLCVAIEDSGVGILTPAGQRARAHEIEKIFELGYTTQRISGSTGEGLGLNWVRTIIQDLHGGQIYAENTDEAGARFVLVFPPLEQSS